MSSERHPSGNKKAPWYRFGINYLYTIIYLSKSFTITVAQEFAPNWQISVLLIWILTSEGSQSKFLCFIGLSDFTEQWGGWTTARSWVVGSLCHLSSLKVRGLTQHDDESSAVCCYNQCYNVKCNFPWIMTGMTIRCNVTHGYE